MTTIEFTNKYLGAKIDYDGRYGFQCHTKGHYVLMSDYTYKAIEDIKIGDKVISKSNKINTVTDVMSRDAKTLKIRSELCDLIVTAEHPYYTKDGKFEKVENFLNIKPATFNFENDTESTLTDDELLFLGFFLGDGSYSKETSTVRIIFGEKKKEFVEKLNLKISWHTKDEKYYSCNLITKEHNKLYDIIKLCVNEKGEKVLPLIFTNREYSFILQGLLYADGYKKRKNEYVISNTSLSLLFSIQAIALLLGYDTKTIREIKREHKSIFIKGKEVKNIKPIYKLTLKENSRKKIKQTIKQNGVQTVYNITVDGDNTYLINNYKVHNCVDLFRKYIYEVYGIVRTEGVVGAKDFYFNYEKMPILKQYFELIKTKEPYLGDIVVFNGAGNNTYGHIAICLGNNNNYVLVLHQDGFTQNGVEIANLNKDRMLCVLRRRKNESKQISTNQ